MACLETHKGDSYSLCACRARLTGPTLGLVKSILEYVDLNGCPLDSRSTNYLCSCNLVAHDVAVVIAAVFSAHDAIVRTKSGKLLPNVRDLIAA